MKCFNCANLRIQASPAHSNQGAAQCVKNTESGKFMSIKFERDCKDYSQASPAVIIKRMAWDENLNKVK